jgi:translocator protein
VESADALALAGFALASVATASSGGIFRPGEWYEQIAKPRWRPPNWLFGPAWLLLFVLITASAWLVWREAGFGLALVVYAVQMVLNAAWSALFFGLRRPDLAFVNLVALWLSIAAMIALYAPINATAAWMLAPYLAWVAFAGLLNYTIWQMNRMDAPVDKA